MSIFTVPKRIRGTQRVGQIVSAMIRHGFSPWVSTLRLRQHLPWRGKVFRHREKPEEFHPKTRGQRLVAFCEELGPTFVKLGQMLSSRPDILPADIAEDLRALEDRVSAFPTEQAFKIIEEDFGKPVEELFAEFDRVPLASGSIAQTYRATTQEGCDVVVKVRRPGIEDIVSRDMYVLRSLAERIEHYEPAARPYRPVAVIDEFSQSIAREMNLMSEATVTDQIYRFFASRPNVQTPQVFWDLSSSRVLTLTFITGRKFHEAIADQELHLDRRALGRTLLDAFVCQYLDLKVFNADPHPGNLFILPPDKIAIVDFGMAGRLDSKRSFEFVTFLLALYYRQMDVAMDLLAEANALQGDTDVELLKRDVIIFLDKYQSLPLKFVDLQELFAEVMAITRDHHVILPRDFVLLGKSLVSVGGVSMVLDPNLNPNDVIQPKVRQTFRKMFGRENVSREAMLGLWHSGMLLKDLPRQLRQFSRKALRGELKTRVHLEPMDHLIRELDRSSNRISFALIISGVVVSSSLIFHAGVGPRAFGMPILGLTGYVMAGIMGLWLVIAIIRSGRLS